MKGNRSYASLIYLLVLTISLPLTMAQASSSVGKNLGSSIEEHTNKMAEKFPLLSPSEEKGGKSSKFWRFLFKDEDRQRTIPPTSRILKPNTLILQQVKQPHIRQDFAIGSDGSTLTRFAIPGVHGFGQSLGIHPSPPSLQGSMFSGTISDLTPIPITFSTIYLKGQRSLTPMSGFGLSYDHAWSLQADTKIFSEQINLQGEYAWTRYNYDHFIDTSIQNDNAYKLQLSYQPLQIASFFEAPLNGVMGVKHKQVGRFFESPAEPTEEPGISRWEGFTHLDWRGLALNNSIVQEADNGEKSLPPQRTYSTQLQGRYQFQHFKLPLWLGSPNFDMTLSRKRIEKKQQQSSSAEFKADFLYQDWHWNLSHSLHWNKTRTMPTQPGYFAISSAETQFELLSYNNLSLAPMLRYQYQGASFDELLVGIKSRAIFVPERLKGQFQMAAKQNWNNKKSKCTYTTSGNLDWRLAHRKNLLPAVHLFFEGHYQISSNQFNFPEDYRILLGLSLD
ncbi:hypothetical protein Noc_1926 [Nitrosococcus oceani ATCC 19707]|uniref:Uncharacterized protein n=3 Tax=Nitrosococcus oceani TaxID=1229 RepID=Q3J9V8_NITOC|nr:hypothetical protein Noc_1926 [Nitrosococcus oceani ATCC 19707]KFI19196.1 hypothetical protein IB75_10285 [Nitrosococcus oceani C-27]